MRIARSLTPAALALVLVVAGCGGSNGSVTDQDGAAHTPTSGPPADLASDDHPFCAALAEFDDIDTGSKHYTPTEADLPKARALADNAIKNAPEGIKKEVTLYFNAMVEATETAVKTGTPDELELDDLEPEFKEAFGAVFAFAFETCFEMDADFDDIETE